MSGTAQRIRVALEAADELGECLADAFRRTADRVGTAVETSGREC